MSVAELIVRLQEMPQDAQVYIPEDPFWSADGHKVSEDSIRYYDESDCDHLPGVWLG